MSDDGRAAATIESMTRAMAAVRAATPADPIRVGDAERFKAWIQRGGIESRPATGMEVLAGVPVVVDARLPEWAVLVGDRLYWIEE